MTTTVCWGAGWDSTAMLIEMQRRGMRPDLITFADVGAEKPGTYDFVPLFDQWLADHDFPRVTVCEYQPLAKTTERYRAAVLDVAARLGIALDDRQVARLSRIYGNLVANETLPGIAFGMKSCSIKWKVEAQEPPRLMAQPLLDAWHRGERVTKLIGFDATEDHRTFGDGKGMQIGSAPGVPAYGDRYTVEYPLRTWGYDRAACGRIITSAGLPLPPKSACFFCPAMKELEILQLAKSEPTMYALAMEMQRLYRDGRHFRGDNTWSVKARHKVTGDTYEATIEADTAEQVRAIVRAVLKDSSPYRWAINASAAVVGLGRSKQWPTLAGGAL
jgi:hypothetical protein